MKKKKESTRRNFLEYLLYGGGGILAGKHIAKTTKSKGELSKFITADGKVVLIDPRHVRKLEGGRISNQDLQAWMKSGKSD
ncbi:MAG: hypothetical protein OEM26_19205 [Saprospiraceae bacterium]|nr:hypothetical protein [Saprospiraceae bacterium]